MSSAISSIAPNVVHEAVDERQHVRSKLPARVVLSGADDSFACELQDISLGGLGLRCSRELPQGALYDAEIQLELNQVALTIDARVKVIAERGGLTGVEFVELEPRKRDILRYLLSAYLSGEIADINGLFNVMQRENYIKQRKQSQSGARTRLERARALLGSAGYLAAGLAVAGVLAYKSYLLFFSVAYRVPPQMTLPVISAVISVLLLKLFFNILNFPSQLFYIIEIKTFPVPFLYGRTVLGL